VVKNYKLSKRFQICDKQAGQVNPAKTNNGHTCLLMLKTNGKMREIQLPPYGRHLWADKTIEIDKNMANGALLADYVYIWILALDLAAIDCSERNLEAEKCQLQVHNMGEQICIPIIGM
jgi:hypothetical protein